jgi:RNA polymerase I-specific transcription initiation factor RRN3
MKWTIFYSFVAGSLWARVTQPGETSVSRQSAACYIASLLARARYITPRIVRSFLAQMAGWCHSYVAAQQDAVSCDVRQHPVFYTVCQGLFYVVAFRHADLVNTNKGRVKFLFI